VCSLRHTHLEQTLPLNKLLTFLSLEDNLLNKQVCVCNLISYCGGTSVMFHTRSHGHTHINLKTHTQYSLEDQSTTHTHIHYRLEYTHTRTHSGLEYQSTLQIRAPVSLHPPLC
jgi:hypothetical protein